MRIDCPYCGPRGGHEFIARGDASPIRPESEDEAAFADYLYLRENPAGAFFEAWYHAQGCRSWLVIERDTRSHVITAVRPASEAGL